MRNKKSITKFVVTAAIAALSTSQGFAQANLGADCGCPTVASRPTVLVSTLAVSGGALDGELTANNTIFDCSKTWILDKKIYVPSGKTLTIQPGTVIKGNPGTATNASALVVERGGKIFADGEPNCQIVFTAAADNLDGTYPVSTTGQWGGLVLCGRATNNLTLAANGPFQPGVGDGRLAVADGLGTIEGFATTSPKYQYGANLSIGETFDDNDNSGILQYVSIRHAGANLQVGGEINALTLGSVGRGTTIDHVEITSYNDDGIEFFGGTVNVKYLAFLFGNDDAFDWDQGYNGKVQFVFSAKFPDNTVLVDSDNGFECDGDDQKSNLLPRSHPVIYNVTMIGNNKTVLTVDNSSIAAINAKEITEGEIYNSVFANFKNGFNMVKSLGTRTGTSEAYHNWAATGGNGSQSLKVKCNTFVNCTNPLTVGSNPANVLASDNTQFTTTDLNIAVASIPGLTPTWAMNSTTNAVTTEMDYTPNPALSVSGCPVAPVDGFFVPANYRGAFDSSKPSWLSQWAYGALLDFAAGLQSCPTDINGDGVTNNVDFLQLLGQFNQTCD